MKKACYIVEMNSALEGLFEQLDGYGFDYECEEYWLASNCIEVSVYYYPHEIRDLQKIFAPYV